jgi:hypothetical protein
MSEVLNAVVINDNEKAPIVVVPQASEYGIEETKAREIAAVFTPMLEQLKAYEVEYNRIIKAEPSKENSKEARELRLKMVKSRTVMTKEHKILKEFYIKGGQFVDGMKKAYEFGTHSLEEKLEDREKYFENLEKERKENIRLTRLAEIKEFEGTEPIGLAEMEDEQFNTYMIGVKATFEARKEAEAKAAKEQEEKMARLQLAQTRGAETRHLWAFMREDEADIKLGDLTEEEYQILLSTLKERKEDREKELAEARKKADEAAAQAAKEKAEADARIKAAEEKAEKERKEAQAKADEEKRKADEAIAKAKKEAEELKAKIEAEAKAKADEEKRKAEEATKIQELGDAPKFKAMRQELLSVIDKYTFSSEKAKKIQEQLREVIAPKS